MESDGGSATSTSLDTVVIEVDVSDLVNRDIGEISVWRTQWECIQGNRAGQRTGLEFDVLESEAVTRIRQPCMVSRLDADAFAQLSFGIWSHVTFTHSLGDVDA